MLPDCALPRHRRASGTVRARAFFRSTIDRSAAAVGHSAEWTDGRRRSEELVGPSSDRLREKDMFRFFLRSSVPSRRERNSTESNQTPSGMAAAKTRVLVFIVFDLINELLDTKFDQDDKFHPATNYLSYSSFPPILAERHFGEPTRKKKFRFETKVRLG